MLTKEQKQEQSEQLRSALSDISTLFLLENTGLSVNEINQLRSEVRKTEATYKVYKNSVVKLALEGTELEVLAPHMTGPKALAWTSGDGIALAKVLREFIKEHPALALEQAYLEGTMLEAGEAMTIAELPSREELISKLLFILQSPIRRLAVALNAPVRGLAVVLGQIADTREKESEGGS